MIAWPIEAARESGCFDRIMVTTDDREIAELARGLGAEAPFIRPTELSDDHATTIAVIKHALQWASGNWGSVTYACCIYATAPFVRPDFLRRGFEMLMTSGRSFAFSVTSFPFPIQRAVRLNKDGGVEMFQPEHFLTRSQDLDEAFHDAGQFYWGTAEAFLAERMMFSPESVAVVLPRHLVQDIDTLEDWKRAELMFQAIGLGEKESAR